MTAIALASPFELLTLPSFAPALRDTVLATAARVLSPDDLARALPLVQPLVMNCLRMRLCSC